MKKQIEEEIKRITETLVRHHKPEKIILFGSAARGEFGPDSDLDFLIIKKETPYHGIERMREIRKSVKPRVACDFLVARPEEIRERLRLGDPFVKLILEKGQLLYG